MTSMTEKTLQTHREDWKTLENYNIHTDQNMQDLIRGLTGTCMMTFISA